MKFRLAAAGAAILVVTAALALPDPLAADYSSVLESPSLAHPLGTDQLGRDVAARLFSGARVTLGLTVATLLVTGVAGTVVGAAAAVLGARSVVRAADLVAALPTILVGLLAAAISGPGLPSILAAVCAVGWTPFARQAYHLTLREAKQEYVVAARSLGAGTARILARHIAPNIAEPLLAHLLLRFAGTLLTVSGLSFLGLGVQPPTPEWGAMVAEGRNHLFTSPHLVLAPAAAVVITATCATVLGRRLTR
ncbi:ABC transporter permease [Actinoplanes sp. NBC_00393]|uniref:ABC transporter permease n=1 Tax=Actinoplanes sp. NBC_00393 TaxID=2975953 RepID=UPI002E2097B3